ncbi:Uncharacterized membrane protein YsdA, DUF1294 family [Agrobacterium fabrum]|uniref:Uncharacterized membrane protein YsdA, DUF1294 family n=2 Tax=Agrobacterium fabrum TaxID=1176649 RepID=A0A7Z7FPN1_9HYPH|nr:Uncharacterized membrane protein YsdA, DUF1294 family [Agrobacterium fabrum]
MGRTNAAWAQDILHPVALYAGFSPASDTCFLRFSVSIHVMTMIALCFMTYIAFNLFVFLVYWWDKEAARSSGWRIRESTLLSLALVGGSLGAISAQRLLRHKTRKEPFRSILLSIVILQAGLGASLAIMPDWPMRLASVLKSLLQNMGP